MDHDDPQPEPLSYATPPPRRSVEDLLADFVLAEPGRPTARRDLWRVAAWATIALAVLASAVAVFA